MEMIRKYLFLLITIPLSGCVQEENPACETTEPGFLVTNVQVVDGSGSKAFPADVRISSGHIAGIGVLDACGGEPVVDGAGLTLAPGFIDTHSHADSDIFEVPDALASVSQGITTVIVGQDGGSPYPLAEFYLRLEETPTALNFAAYVGHNTIREEVLGDDSKRVATDEEISAMADMLSTELESGALGLSTGLEYEPGIYSATAEVIALAQVAADAGGRYISHVRSEDRWLEDSIDEIITIGRETGMPVQISHFKLAMTSLWGRAGEFIEKLDAARADGVQISADIYPYEYWQSTMMVLLPERDYTDRAAIEEVLTNIAPADGIWMTRYEPNPDYVGKSITDIAAILETDPVSTFTHLAEAADQWQQEHDRRAEMIIGTSMNEADIDELMSWPETNICSDGGLLDLHPRGAGSFPRVLGRYVRERNLMSLETAVHKMSGLAAQHMGFTDRGLIREGMVADLVLFDPETVIDRATPEKPDALSAGIQSVWVNGELVYQDGAKTGMQPGKIIRRN
jgi:N-acyl-D-amino-acid deacylase